MENGFYLLADVLGDKRYIYVHNAVLFVYLIVFGRHGPYTQASHCNLQHWRDLVRDAQNHICCTPGPEGVFESNLLLL